MRIECFCRHIHVFHKIAAKPEKYILISDIWQIKNVLNTQSKIMMQNTNTKSIFFLSKFTNHRTIGEEGNPSLTPL